MTYVINLLILSQFIWTKKYINH